MFSLSVFFTRDSTSSFFFVTQDARFERENIQAKIDLLNSLKKTCTVGGPVFDCVVFHDGQSYR